MALYNTSHTILFILLQGREFTEEFLLEYQREDGGEWMRFRNKYGEEVKLLNAGIVALQYFTHNNMIIFVVNVQSDKTYSESVQIGRLPRQSPFCFHTQNIYIYRT